jgi:hypothetical protein
MVTMCGICHAHSNGHMDMFRAKVRPSPGGADKQEVMPAVRERLSCQIKCCNQAEIVKTQFRVSRAQDEDQWFYLTKENKWKRIPPDIIHPLEEHTPTHQPVLFIRAATEVCFWVEGIDG